MNSKNSIIVLVFFLIKITCLGQVYFSSGLSYSTESFNLQNKIGSTNSNIYKNIQYNPSLFFGTIQMNNNFSKMINKSSYISVDNFIRYNHHFYKRLVYQNGLETHKSIPQVKKIKIDLFLDFNKIIKLNKTDFIFGVGIGYNNINSGYNYTYNDTIRNDPYLNGTVFNKSFKGNWLKFTPKILIGIEYKKYLFSIDAIFTKDPTFEDLLSTSVRISIKRKLFKLF